jgi:beta-phosphoglucomutase-like phosphatase (HAD superfamily)
MTKLIIFDWDDVIILGAKKGYYNCYKKTLKELGIVLDEKEIDKRIQDTWGNTDREIRVETHYCTYLNSTGRKNPLRFRRAYAN